jgi:hypothetical protein
MGTGSDALLEAAQESGKSRAAADGYDADGLDAAMA